MTTAQARTPATFSNAAEWVHALGNVPLERILVNPLPATEKDLAWLVDRKERLVELVDGTLVEKHCGCWKSVVGARLLSALGSFFLFVERDYWR